MEALIADLNAAQRVAVLNTLGKSCLPEKNAPLLVIAGAGTGKTKTLAHRVASLILNGARPERILLMTFARRMAAEMTRRVERICATALESGAAFSASIEWAGTFHAISAKLLRLHAHHIGLAPGFSPSWWTEFSQIGRPALGCVSRPCSFGPRTILRRLK